jgi:hypothetical protein
MKTDDLIGMLATGAGPAPRAVVARRLAPVLLGGAAASALLAVGFIGLVPTGLFDDGAWWAKLGYAAGLAMALTWPFARLARPVAHTRAPWRLVGAVVLAMVLLGSWQVLQAEPGSRSQALLGHSWASCPWNVLLLSLPALGGAFWALRGLAPTRPRATGLAAGLLAGAVGAAGYALSCSELSMAFVAVWYTLGIALAGALGALLGPRLLRW